jgi:DNA polymerase-3 subunit delta
MIILIEGENSFERSRELQQISRSATSPVERFEGRELELRQLPDLLMATTLFQDERTIIIDELSANKVLWEALPGWLDRQVDSTTLVLVEPKPDKRTKTYKQLVSKVTVIKVEPWTDRDRQKATTWVMAELKQRGLTLPSPLVAHIIDRTGPDQWALFHAIEKLSLLDEVTIENIDLLVEAHPQENIFRLFELILASKHAEVKALLKSLRLSSDPHSILALLASQAYQLAALFLATEADNPQKDFSIHPFVASKLQNQARRLTNESVAGIVNSLAQADRRLKTSSVDAWFVLEQALDAIAIQLKQK